MTSTEYAELELAFHPNSIAIVGASDNPYAASYTFTRSLIDYDFQGQIYPINHGKETICNLKAYTSLSSIPALIDYVICCIPASGIPDLLDECANRGVKFVHIFSGRLSETGNRKAANLEADILRKAKALNIRLIGPNCMGIFHPRLGISYSDDLPKEPGDVGGLFQSGGLSILFSRYGGLQGLRFSKIISFGNALDLDECDFLEYLAHDEETKIITCYIEGAKDGARLLDVLREATSVKPVVMLKGGKGIIGKKTAGSHTSALAGSDAVWQTALRQTGVIQVDDVNQLVDVVTLLSSLPSIMGRRAAVIGASGGQSVLAADACERVGFELPPLPSEVKEALKSRMPEFSDWIGNPIDVSAAGAFFRPGEMLEMVAKNPEFDFTIVNIDEGAPVHQEMWCDIIGGVIDSAIDLSQKQVKPIIVVLSGGKIHQQQFSEWRWQFLADLRSRLIAAHVPVYSTMIEAVTALQRYIDFFITREDG